METDSGLDDYVSALRNLKSEIDQYGDVAGALQKVSAAILNSNQTLRTSQVTINEFAKNAALQLDGVQNSLDKTLSQIQGLGLEAIFEQLSGRYDTHQTRLDQLAKSVEDAVREQQRLGLQLIQQTTAFQTELSGIAGQFRLNADENRAQQAQSDAMLRAFATELPEMRDTLGARIADAETLARENHIATQLGVSANKSSLSTIDSAIDLHTKLLLLLIMLVIGVLLVSLIN